MPKTTCKYIRPDDPRDKIAILTQQNKALSARLQAIESNPAGHFKAELERLESFYPEQLRDLQLSNGELRKQLRDVRTTLESIISQLPA